MKKTLILIVCVLTAALTLCACGGRGKPQKLILKELPKTVYYIGENEQNFYDSLEDGSVIIRYANNTDLTFAMSDEDFEVTGFTTESIGTRHATISHKEYSHLTLQFSYTVVEIQPISFKISTLPTRLSYPNNVSAIDIDLDGIKIKITTNDNVVSAETEMQADDFEIVQIDFLSHDQARVSIKLKNTFMIEKFDITLTEPAE